ncbi:SDR family oxidoreductase [Cupriavidus plantarum]|uniref:SDR family oxidoreductase n=1 Tax=Cupriavidus plantarum TaxID=942865 RepID=UPI000E23FFD4|nr:SDR family oxidoreductase [Cupriavidus plantarum]NYH98527.1 NAD(P)-dependent dehydrogenase (short-subunit alcohol dehydrogenase family) [Cupriavidus plantarum]REF01456.1 NAD(P)-dependent dehydrogenase (short-subunit alcohol dehydrogenase family) [Cupriavidus plantarum]RLK45678.1 NAD(P)-dependent dehydrogenase (short-subunit alcohol dehydrogenase family) [Cupriavidus plantarum]CAG2127987.1 putative oxidoreductase YgfF [Cupriavidus plantarum]SMR66835.1 NAD(P)-dependent dehydrogenase, short-ch
MTTASASPLILITGGSRGVGAATARLAAAKGYDVAISYVSNESAAEAVVADIKATGRRALAVRADSADPRQVAGLFEAIDQKFGRLDVLVNNAAMLSLQSRLEDLSYDRMQRIFAVNTIGPILCAQQAIKRMSHRHNGKGGSIVNVSSAAARLGSPNEYIDYAASKGALETFTTGLAKELAREGIRVNCVRPGHIYTEMHASGGEPGRVDRVKDSIPMGRGGQPEEVARAILWLASEEASFVTGTFLDATGGK